MVEVSRPLCELKPIQITDVHTHRQERSQPDRGRLDAATGNRGHSGRGAAGTEGHRDLGIHTELVSDQVIPLIEAGVINGSRKTIHPRKIVLSFVLGTKKLFDYVNNNPVFEFHPSKYTNDPFLIPQTTRWWPSIRPFRST